MSSDDVTSIMVGDRTVVNSHIPAGAPECRETAGQHAAIT
jgi:hypothetical protein